MLCTKLIKLNKSDGIKCMTLEEVFKQYERLLHEFANKWHGTYEHEDLFQIASLGLIKAYNAYDINKGFSFATYLGIVANNEILMFNRRSRKYNNNQSMNAIIHVDTDGNDLTVGDTVADEIDYEELVLEKIYLEELPEAINELLSTLTDRERKIITYRFIDGLEQWRIAEKLDISQSFISRVIQKSLKKLKDNYIKKRATKVADK